MEEVILEALQRTEATILEVADDEARAAYFECVRDLGRQAVAIAAVSVISKYHLPPESFPYGCLCDVASGHHFGPQKISASFSVNLQALKEG